MWLYTNDDGLTRLRLFVMGFLVFEAVGLLLTFFYISKPRFNITLVYLGLALVYYMLLNVFPTDRIIADNQIKKYTNGERENLNYVYTLSADAAKPLADLYEITDNITVKKDIKDFISRVTTSDIPDRWQRYNLAIHNAKKIFEKLN